MAEEWQKNGRRMAEEWQNLYLGGQNAQGQGGHVEAVWSTAWQGLKYVAASFTETIKAIEHQVDQVRTAP